MIINPIFFNIFFMCLKDKILIILVGIKYNLVIANLKECIMSSYRSAYENYYKNINNAVKGNKDNNKHFTLGKSSDNSISLRHGVNNDTMGNFIIKRIIRELTGATILLLFFVGLKYTPLPQVKEMHIKCKQTLSQNFNYNESIEVFNSIQIGNVKGKDLQFGGFTTEDLKIENLKVRASNFMDYLKNNNTMQN